MAHLRLLLSHTRRHSHPHRLLPLFHFSSDASSSSAPRRPPPPIKPVSYAPKPKQEAAPEEPAAPPTPYDGRDSQSSLPRRPQQPAPPREWTRQDMRYVKDAAPVISPVSYPSRVAPLPEDRPAGGDAEGVPEEGLRGEGERIQMEAARATRNIFGMQVEEEEQVPYPTIIPVVKRPQKVAIDLVDAIRLVKTSANEKKRNFVETIEAHVMLGVDPRRGDQVCVFLCTIPRSVFAEGPAADEARAAGADVVGGDELIEEIRKGGGKLSFDKCIATPMFMPRLSKVARILGPRGLMPNPKVRMFSRSVTNDVSGAVKAAKSGRVNFSEESLRENIGAFVHALLLAKPVGLKKTSKYVGYVKKFTLSSTMGPGFPVTIPSLSVAADHYNKVQVS
ncbi:hypothetical protein HU200_046867 [Digitaria exilis]|uniref:Ribosomal protein n=1 Tax=Digitaria exilis TaxID=1010633 RepID=A0A835AVX9_9POAL|nr:hypothetical protein HU200_046867 [Digitaria exilis]